ncbi:MAG: YaiI/YqxD family protein [Faecalicatena sp.]|uniref:YaiI/YqxD family protein n=1 Tax=Faecalicatena sp. TaxID=2005360 RepID=UPI00258FF880|nr:YaiI/YqxD family protein [Faecalicatena sp.]MCI6467514.1 YaiI/YqxD family protein [Faecalicatena sp.]MDY5619690.1 YaiI/YqxD family protein [Lachnospiraceae bacterium]
MRIIVDADACPVTGIVERVAKERDIPVTLVCDTAHIFQSQYSQVVTVEKGADSADFKIVTISEKGDIVVTQDYGVASMCLGKGIYPIHQSGKWYTLQNIDQMMFERHIAKEVRRKSKKNHLKGPRKRTREDDEHFEESLKQLIEKVERAEIPSPEHENV